MTEKEIFEIENTRPHVVILGAGATVANIPNGDKYGNPCYARFHSQSWA